MTDFSKFICILTAVNLSKCSPVSLSMSPTHASNPYCTFEVVLLNL